MNEFDHSNLPDGVKGVLMEVGPDGFSPRTQMTLFENLIQPATVEAGPFGAPRVAASLCEMAALALYMTMIHNVPREMRESVGEEFSPKAFLTRLAEISPDHGEIDGKMTELLESFAGKIASLAKLGPINPDSKDAVIEGFEKLLAGEKPDDIISAQKEAEAYNEQRAREAEAEYLVTQAGAEASAEDESTVDDPEEDHDA